jgi:hypothetical protein
MSTRRKKLMRLGLALNVSGAVGLLAVGSVKGLASVMVLGIVEALFSALVLWTYLRTPVHPDAP